MSEARERILSLLAAARRIADARDPLGQEARARLPGSSGLSPEGVALALEEHLETASAPDELDALLARAESARCCHVVLAANVCTAPLRALACALAASARVRVRPSRRDPVLAALLLRALGSGHDIELGSAVVAEAGDQVHAYGSDEATAAIAAALPPGVRFRAYGTGVGIACVEAGAEVEAAAAIARDLVPFDGRGCLSPRIVITTGDAHALGEALDRALAALGESIPRGPLSADDVSALARARAAFEAVGEVYAREHHFLAVDDTPAALPLLPPLRSAAVVHGALDSLAALLAPLARYVAAIGGQADGALFAAACKVCPRARRSTLGRMQKPPLDGPVDLR